MDAFWFVPSVVGVIAVDPSAILSSVSEDERIIEATLAAPSVVSRSPELGARWSAPIADILGVGQAANAEDLLISRLWLGDNGIPRDTIEWLVLSQGPLSATSPGVAVGLEWTSTAPRVRHAVNLGAGAGWAITSASAGVRYTAGAELQVQRGSATGGGVSLSVRAHAIDGSGAPIDTASTATGTTSGPAAVPWDTVSLVVGWSTGVGGVAGSTVRFGGALSLLKVADLPAAARSSWDYVPNNPPRVFLWGGASNGPIGPGPGNPTDPDWGNVAVPAGVLFYLNGVQVTTFGPRPGPVPYLITRLLALGVPADEIVIIGWGGSGIELASMTGNTKVAPVIANLYDLGALRPDVLIETQGGGDMTATLAPLYADTHAEWERLANATWPGVPIVACETFEVHTYEAPVLAVQYAQDHVVLTRTGPGLPTSDGSHFTPGIGNGMDQLSGRILAELGYP